MNEELFVFTLGMREFLYTSGEADVTLGGKIYRAVSIRRKEISKDSLSDDAQVVCSFDLDPVPLFRDFNPSSAVYLQILKNSGVMMFFGRISSVEFNLKNGEATLKLSAMGGLMHSKIPVRTYSHECAFELFDEGCALNEADFRLIVPGAECKFSVDKREISHPKIKEKGADFFVGGFVSYNLQHSYITGGDGEKLYLMFPIRTLEKSGALYIYAGCDKRISTCKAKFNNSKNYGGFPFIPSKNPVTSGF